MKQDPAKIKYFVYVRKSSEQEDRQVLSIDSQKDELDKIVKELGIKVVDILEESYSAKKPGRPKFNGMMARIEKGEGNGLLVWSPNRISRNPIDTGAVVYAMDLEQLVEVRTPSQLFKNNPNDKFLLALFCNQAKLENDNKGVDVKRGLAKKARMGTPPTPAPVGYLNDRYGEKGSKTWFKDQDRFDLCRKTFELMLTGNYTAQDVRRIVNEKLGFTMPSGKPMSRNNIYAMFTNTVYYGMFEYPRGSGEWFKGVYEPMITPEEYDKIQFLLGRKSRPRPKKHVFDFPGMMKCGECEGNVIAEEKWKHQKNGNIHHYIFYHCSKRVHIGCTQGSIEYQELKKQIGKYIGDFTVPSSVHTFMMKWFIKQHDKESTSRNSVLKSQQKSYQACLDSIDGLIDMRAAKLIGDSTFKQKIAPLERKKMQLEELLNDTGKRATDWIELAKDFSTFVEYALQKFNGDDLQRRRAIFAALGQNRIIKDKELFVDLEKTLIPMKTV